MTNKKENIKDAIEKAFMQYMEWKLSVTSWSLVKGIKHIEACHKIHPLQQKAVDKLLTEIDNNPGMQKVLKRVYIFGSSVTADCNSWSDLDVACEFINDDELRNRMKVFRQLIRNSANTDYDFICLNDIDIKGTELYDNIIYEGAIIWERIG